jgi:CheY-like chemotaxis protein
VRVAASALAPARPTEPPERRLVLLGFSSFERHQLETVFRLAAARTARYRLVEQAHDADIAVADADDAAAMAQLRARGLPAVLVGATDSGGPVRLARPINIAQVVRSLDTLARSGPPPTAPVQRVLDELAHVAGVPPLRPKGRVLLAAAASAATRNLAAPLQRAGFELVQARSGAEAIERARGSAFDLVVIDAGLDGLDGYHACRTIHRHAERSGGPKPRIVLIAAGPAAVSRVRAEMAGAELLLEPPLDAAELFALLPTARPT